jgi:hypothetical protein
MGFWTGIIISHKGKKCSHITKNGLEYDFDDIIKNIIPDICLYKDYIVNMSNFLNRNNYMKFWDVGDTWGDLLICVDITEIEIIITKVSGRYHAAKGLTKIIPIIKKVTPEFHNFINRRFLLPQICKKFNIPKDIHNYLLNLFFVIY